MTARGVWKAALSGGVSPPSQAGRTLTLVGQAASFAFISGLERKGGGAAPGVRVDGACRRGTRTAARSPSPVLLARFRLHVDTESAGPAGSRDTFLFRGQHRAFLSCRVGFRSPRALSGNRGKTGVPSQLRVCVQRSTRTERAPRAGRQATSGGRKDAPPTGSRALPLSHRGARGEHPLPRHAPSLPRWNFPGKLSPPETPGSRRRFPWKSGGWPGPATQAGFGHAQFPGPVRGGPRT